MNRVVLCTIAFLIPGIFASNLIGYDCGGDGLNITSLSLIDIADCHVDDLEPKAEETYVQLLQLNEFDYTRAIQCKIEIDSSIYYCGMHSHISAVSNGKHEYIQEISGDTCKKLHTTGAILLGTNILLDGIKPNRTTVRNVNYAGTIANNGECKGTTFSDPFGTWNNVVVQATISITLRDFELPVKSSSNEVILPSGVHCKATEEECRDNDGSLTHWKTIPTDSCKFNNYDVLYEGLAHRLTPPHDQESSLTVYTVTSGETVFALAKTSDSTLCGYKMIHTEHPKLFIHETQRDKTFKSKTRTRVENLDIFTYVNSKFVYVERHFRNQLTRLYKDIMSQKCALERQVLENALSLSSIAPDEMAFRLMRTPGYTAVTAGEVIYLIKCIPVPCKFRQTENCYNELPVTHGNNSYFLTPRSRILIKTGTLKDCNELLPPMFHFQDTWFRMTPRPVESLPPPIIRPLTKPKWKYVSPSHLATSGIYSAEDLDRLRSHIMFPVEKPSMLNTLTQGAMGKTIPTGSISLFNLMDEKSLEKIAESMGSRLWKGFTTFGSASAGIFSIIFLIQIGKLIVDSFIRGYALHSIYGWSIHLVAAIWSSITHLLIYLSSRKQRGEEERREDKEETLQVLVNPEPDSAACEMKTENKIERSQQDDQNGTGSRGAPNYSDLNRYLSFVESAN